LPAVYIVFVTSNGGRKCLAGHGYGSTRA